MKCSIKRIQIEYIYFSICLHFTLLISVIIFNGCDNTEVATNNNSDSLLVPLQEIIHFKSQDSLDINFRILKGKPITSVLPIEIYFSRDSVYSDNKINLPSISINGSNIYYDIDTSIHISTYGLTHYFLVNKTWALIQQGDRWIINYEIFTNDGGGIINKISTIISYDNFFAGKYVDSIYYFNSKIGNYPNQPATKKILDKDLISIDENNCNTDFTILGIEGEKCIIYVGPKDSVSISAKSDKYQLIIGDPKDSTKISRYVDKTGTIYLYYNFYDSNGLNIIWESLTSK